MDDLLSIIMPVYNTNSEYLSKAIESVVNQTYSNFQLIIVDDGSEKETAQLIDSYAEKNEKIVVLHQKNSGQSIARNNGMDLADGKWIYFMDSDDWLELDTFELVINKLNETNTDVCLFGFDFVYSKKSAAMLYDINNEAFYDINDYTSFNIFNQYGIPWNRIYKFSCIKGHCKYKNMTFEDCLFVFSVYPYISSFSVVNNVCYHYRQLSSSYTYKVRNDYADRINLFDSELNNCLKSKMYPENADKVRNNYYVSFLSLVVKNTFALKDLSLHDKRKVIKEFISSERFQEAVNDLDAASSKSKYVKLCAVIKKPPFLLLYLIYLYTVISKNRFLQ